MATKFRLEAVLSLRNNVEKMKQKELADAYAFRAGLVAQKEEMIQNMKQIEEDLRRELSGKIDPYAIDNFNNYKVELSNAILKMDERIERAEELVLDKQNSLVQAMKDRKILENLKELHKQEQEAIERAAEQQLVDEIVSYRYITQERGS